MALIGLKRSDRDHTDDPDVALMLAFQGGDEEAFVTLYRRHRDRIVNFARRLLGSQALGEEAAQETFLRLHRARTRYRPDSRFSTYLYRIAKNLCLNVRGRREHQLLAPDVAVQTLPGAAAPQEARAEQARARTAIAQALGHLPDTQAAAFVLCRFEGLSLVEAAEVLDTSVPAIKSLVFRARRQLALELVELGEGYGKASHAMP
jgi:RNA polymerase sigma-70 factor, ECF subfamily